ncbi:MAG: LacI family DNA-binding transcriptional regulator [Ardenticatenaceae bacterium]|nr:LacI family DNA-binding transcriptional regulator [Ardenticatenaceae bacterium]MCB8949746.1 LacI family DNA-binding transcriptional regulator [Ardenticatenaceae bacterium]
MAKENGYQRVTIEDVAQRAGVSTATVSRVLNKSNNVSPKTVARVETAVDELGYVLNTAARVLANNKTGNIGIIVPATSNPFLTSLLEGINQSAITSGYNLLIYATTKQATIQGGVPLPLNEGNTDGLLIFADSVDERTLEHMHRHQFPMVLLYHEPPPDLTIPCVLLENKDGAYQLIEHLIKNCGHRRIAFMAGPAGNQDSYWREQGYREALADNGLPVDPALLGTGSFHDWEAKKQIEKWLAEGLAFDALFAGDDTAAMASIVALQQAGRRVPEDTAVVGFNNDTLSQYITPPLTTVHAPTSEIGRTAANKLLQLIRGEQIEQKTMFSTQLVIRQSCGYHLADK